LGGHGSWLLVRALPQRSCPRHRLAASPAQLKLPPGGNVVGVGDQRGRDRGSRTNGGGDAEIDELTVDQHEGRVITGHYSHKQGGDAQSGHDASPSSPMGRTAKTLLRYRVGRAQVLHTGWVPRRDAVSCLSPT
jgi:hypothetical protein